MATILDKYGIKEVADVTFYELDSTGKPTVPVLYLDTLKVSTIEQTGEEADARGGKGNAILMSWDYNKEITVTLEDALFSAKSMAIMFGNGTVKNYAQGLIMKTEQFRCTTSQSTATSAAATGAGWTTDYEGPNGVYYGKVNPHFYTADGAAATSFVAGEIYFCTYDIIVSSGVIDISANSFPGTYYVTGDTYARSQESGKDEFFQFIIPKAKVQSENTITLEAEGDPSTFNMSLKVLRPADGVMMRLVKYDAIDSVKHTDTDSGLIHNHGVNENNFDYNTVNATDGLGYGVATNGTITKKQASTTVSTGA